MRGREGVSGREGGGGWCEWGGWRIMLGEWLHNG